MNTDAEHDSYSPDQGGRDLGRLLQEQQVLNGMPDGWFRKSQKLSLVAG